MHITSDENGELVPTAAEQICRAEGSTDEAYAISTKFQWATKKAVFFNINQHFCTEMKFGYLLIGLLFTTYLQIISFVYQTKQIGNLFIGEIDSYSFILFDS